MVNYTAEDKLKAAKEYVDDSDLEKGVRSRIGYFFLREAYSGER